MTAPSTSSCPPPNGICSNAIFSNSTHAVFLRNTKIVVEENKRKYTANNVYKECIAKIKVDGGIIQNASISKSDYIFIRCEYNMVYFIELKGGDVAKACEQIISTIANLSSLLLGSILHARIVCSRAPAPALRSSQYARLDRCCRNSNGQLIVRVNQFEESYITP